MYEVMTELPKNSRFVGRIEELHVFASPEEAIAAKKKREAEIRARVAEKRRRSKERKEPQVTEDKSAEE
jgi:hypothetical protein